MAGGKEQESPVSPINTECPGTSYSAFPALHTERESCESATFEFHTEIPGLLCGGGQGRQRERNNSVAMVKPPRCSRAFSGNARLPPRHVLELRMRLPASPNRSLLTAFPSFGPPAFPASYYCNLCSSFAMIELLQDPTFTSHVAGQRRTGSQGPPEVSSLESFSSCAV